MARRGVGSHGQPELVGLDGAANQAASRIGADTSRHRDASLDRLVDGTHGTHP
jgi:hypothetical protein